MGRRVRSSAASRPPGDRRVARCRHLRGRDVLRDHGAARRALRRRSVARRDEPLRQRVARPGDERRVLRLRRLRPGPRVPPSYGHRPSAGSRGLPGADGPRRPQPDRRPACSRSTARSPRRRSRRPSTATRRSAAFVMLVVAMLLFSLACRGDDRWWSVRWVSMGLALTAAGAAVGDPAGRRLRVLRCGAAGARRRRTGMVPGHGDARPAQVVRRIVISTAGWRRATSPRDRRDADVRAPTARARRRDCSCWQSPSSLTIVVAPIAPDRRCRPSTTAGWRG